MSELQVRIAAVLREHRIGPGEYDRFRQRMVVSCWGCARLFRDADDHAGHQAELTAAIFTEEIQRLPVFVDDDPPAFHDDLVNPRPKRHIEFHDHTRYRTAWNSPDCPDCITEPGVHDRRHAEILAATQDQP